MSSSECHGKRLSNYLDKYSRHVLLKDNEKASEKPECRTREGKSQTENCCITSVESKIKIISQMILLSAERSNLNGVGRYGLNDLFFGQRNTRAVICFIILRLIIDYFCHVGQLMLRRIEEAASVSQITFLVFKKCLF